MFHGALANTFIKFIGVCTIAHTLARVDKEWNRYQEVLYLRTFEVVGIARFSYIHIERLIHIDISLSV